MIGGGMVMYVSWVVFTLIGGMAGNFIEDPARWGLDFAFTAVFIALLVGMWKGKSSLAPWIVAASVAALAHHYLPGQWYILLGGLMGSLAGVMSRG